MTTPPSHKIRPKVTIANMMRIDPYICPAIPLLALNTFLLCLGCFLLGLGAHTLTHGDTATLASYLAHTERLHHHPEEARFSLNLLAVVATFLGAWLTLLGLLGVSGTLSGMMCLLMLYINLATGTLAALLAVGAILYFSMDTISSGLTVSVHFGLHAYYGTDMANPVSEHWFTGLVDRVQTEFKCCGLHNYTEFDQYAVQWREMTATIIPVSCCKPFPEPYNISRGDPLCPSDPTPNNSYISTPCAHKLGDWLEREKNKLLTVWLGMIFFLLLLIGLSLLLVCC